MNSHSWIAPKQPVWILKNTTFIKAIIESTNNDIVICLLEDGNYVQSKKHLIFQRNPAYKEFNPERSDLMDTDVLNEPQVLKTLKLRLQNSRIYTFVQNSIISVNPYYSIPALYSEPLKQFYAQSIIDQDQNFRYLQPHLYSISSFMLNCLKKQLKNQAVIISGQSGAGKTQANKECLRFLQFFFHRAGSSLDQRIDNILSLSNPILQAFGNSKTIRNNNSSRFGKYLNISVNSSLDVKHVKIYNYLLQKSRIISRAENQQNFHIFYQLLRGLSKTQKSKYFLSNSQKELKMEDFAYLRCKSVTKYESHPDISFQKVRVSLSTLQNPSAFDLVCRVLSAILLIGNLNPYESENQDCCKIANQQVLDQICQLLQIKRQILSSSLTCYPIKIGSQLLTKYFNARQVQELLNSFAKILYEKLFQWIINEINSVSHYQGNEQLLNLGFLDIYGFQILQNNSLEQLFINYTNERLHQIYLTKVFKEQEDLFKEEGLIQMFKTIPYQDNMAVLQLIDYESLSIFNLLDEWCSVASPDDSSFITKLRHKHKKHPKFPTSNFNLPSTMFLIRHSPKDIEYTVVGFRDKNKDLVREQIKTAVRSSSLQGLSIMFRQNSQNSQNNVKNNHKFRKFLSTKFRHQIGTLITQLLGNCNLHFIRCVKSNSIKKPLYMQDEVVYNQICYLGILDTIKLKKLGYCIKISYEQIDKRFKWLVRFYYTMEAFQKQIIQYLKNFLNRYGDEEMLFGKSKIFFKDYAYSTLVKKYALYLKTMESNTSKIQRAIIAFNFQRKLSKTKVASRKIKKYLAQLLAERRYNKIHQSIVKIQKTIREKLQILKKNKRLKQLLIIQKYIKKQICRKNKQKVFGALEKIIGLISRYRIRKNIQKFAIINQLKNYIIDKSWRKIVLTYKNTIQNYFLGFLTQISGKSQIIVANRNAFKKQEQTQQKTISKYIQGLLQAHLCNKHIQQVQLIQKILRTWIYRQKYLKLKKAAIVIQRAYRQYYFNKNTAKQIFQQNFGQQKIVLDDQNLSIRSFLYDNSMQNTVRILYNKYLDRFRQKCSLFYIIIDFETLVNLDFCYPDNSWMLNYFEVVKEGFQKDSPIQSLEVAESYTVAATTNRLYLWGMNSQYNTYQNNHIIKPQPNNRIEKMQILYDQLEITYEQTKRKNNSKLITTVNKEFQLENGKLFESKGSTLRLIKIPQANERIMEVACGASHTIFRTSLKKVYTFGNGKQGQLGHNNYHSIDHPKILQFPEIKNYYPLQVSASFNSSILLLSNHKIYWCGTNGSIQKIKVPKLFDIASKFQQFGSGFAPLKVKGSWSRSLSIIGITLLSFNGKLSNNIGLRNKIYQLIISKWQDHDFDSLNPPFYPSFTDYLQECHVKMPKSKQSIEPQSKKIFRKLEQKVNSIQTDKFNDISFSDPYFK